MISHYYLNFRQCKSRREDLFNTLLDHLTLSHHLDSFIFVVKQQKICKKWSSIKTYGNPNDLPKDFITQL